MTGTLVNCVAVAAGGAIGCLFKKGIKESYMNSVNMALGLSVLVIGINGIVSYMINISDGKLSSSGELLLVVFLVLGTFFGELLKLDERFNRFCGKIESRLKKGGFAAGFVNGTALFCVGAMAIVGSLTDGLNNDPSILFIKSALDFTAAIIFGASMGFGVIFSFIPLLLYQGGITLAAGALDGILQGDVLDQVCFTGYAIIMAIGLNFLLEKKFKTLNMLPALILPVAYHYILVLIELIKNKI